MSRKTEKKLARKAARKELRKTIRALSQPSPGLSPARPWGDPTAGQASGARVPPGLDDQGVLLHATIAGKAAREGVAYFEAMSRLTANPAYRQLSDIPPTPAPSDEPGLMTEVDPERAQLYSAARALAVSQGIGFMDACELLDNARELSELERVDGSGAVPWLDSTPLATPPRPWSDEDWARDQRRAAAAGVDVDHVAWLAGAERGEDIVGQVAEQARQDKISALKERSAPALENAQRREDERRTSALQDELTARARRRTQEAAAAAAAPSWHSSYNDNGL